MLGDLDVGLHRVADDGRAVREPPEEPRGRAVVRRERAVRRHALRRCPEQPQVDVLDPHRLGDGCVVAGPRQDLVVALRLVEDALAVHDGRGLEARLADERAQKRRELVLAARRLGHLQWLGGQAALLHLRLGSADRVGPEIPRRSRADHPEWRGLLAFLGGLF